MTMMADMHVHTTSSDGEASLEQAVALAAQAGMAAVAITDHMDPHAARYQQSPAKMMDEDGLRRAIRMRDNHKLTWPIQTFIGLERGPLPVDLGDIRPDVIIASAHYVLDYVPVEIGNLFCESYWLAYMRTVMRIATCPQVHILGHMAGYLPLAPLLAPGSTFEERRAMEREIGLRFLSRYWYEQVFRAAAARGIAVEIHCPTRSPSPEMVRMGVRMGVRFTVGSDAHAKSWIGDVAWGYDVLSSLGAGVESVWSPAPLRQA